MKIEYYEEICSKLREWHSERFHIGINSIVHAKTDGIYDIIEVDYFCANKNIGLSGGMKRTFKFLNNNKEGSVLSSEL